MLTDIATRSVNSAEILLSILITLIGAPMIGFILVKNGKKWS